ncbi:MULTISPECIES: DUF4230 domain-containing protein [unclassified Actinomyces]|uniref:DUF4230 domain-containing protein n=1 Tax=unclassified Actinomyces TaxID=2609248 RepID=UPI000D58DA08|nr:MULTISPECIES: DUF4230 domain-containing protein [unclassified Actinomyces]RAX19818.1 DUF4230 domain-containing protein [Actinomyces sp. Z5]RAX20148.1 DUF4230 domain-containing protein [Actinomyces sp. Z3]
MKKRIVKGVLSLVAGIAVIGAAFGGLAWAGVLGVGKPTMDSTTIAASFEDIAELATEEYNFTNVGKYSESGNKILAWDVPLTGGSFLITYNGTVKAGIADFSAVSIEIDDQSKFVELNAPAVEILSSTIDPAIVHTYDQSFSLVNQLDVDDVTTFLAAEEANVQQVAIDGGVLDKARIRAEELLTSHVESMLAGTDRSDYTVSVEWSE